MPWKPRTRGGILLPPRKEANEEEEGEGLSPPRFRWRRSAARATIGTSIYINNFATINTNFLPLYAAV